MKKIRLLSLFSLIIICLSVICACRGLPDLSCPENLEIEMTTLTLNWDEVRGARMYTVRITDNAGGFTENVSGKNSYSLESLAEGKYSIKVKAHGKDAESDDSEWSKPIAFTRDPEPGMVFTLINNNTEYQVSNKGIATGDIVIPGTYRGKPVTAIGEKAFFNKSDVSSVVLGENIKTIGDFAFANCSYVTSVTLPDSLTHIGESAFASCRLLSGEIVIPDGVKEISESAFAYCARITGVVFGSGLQTIGKTAFTDCKGITSLSLPNNVTSLGESAFAACEGLLHIEFGSGIETITSLAFSGATSLEIVTIPDTVKTIGEKAFYNCTSLAEVTLGTGICEVDMDAFRNTHLWNNSPTNEIYADGWFVGCVDETANTINLKQGTVGIANYALCGYTALDDVILPDCLVLIGEGAFADSSVKNVVIGAGVKTIGANAFLSCDYLTTVCLGSYDFDLHRLKDSSLEVIENYAFKDCPLLEEIEKIPDTVKMIGAYVFRGTGMYNASEDGLVYAGKWLVDYTDSIGDKVIVRDGTVGVANYAFYECEAMTSVRLPQSIVILGRAAFYDCASLNSVNLPDELEVIEDYTFYRCYSLKLFDLPPALKSIGRSAFYKCGTVYYIDDEEGETDTLTIPDSVEYIGDYAFYASGLYVPEDPENETAEATYGIDILVIGNGVKTIGANAFYGFASLKHLTIGNGVKVIGEKAFYNCNRLETVTFGNSIEQIGDKAFYRCSKIDSVLLPNTVLKIGTHAFYRCEGIKELELGNSVESIGDYAFYGSREITEVLLPPTLLSIGKQAFRNCKALTSVIIAQNVEQMGAHAFYGCDSLTVYAGYDAAPEGWHTYWNSSYRPVVWGCNISEENDYVVSVEKKDGSIYNRISSNVLSAPVREGYTFVGWSTSSTATQATYTAESLIEAPNGRRFYAIWIENVEAE